MAYQILSKNKISNAFIIMLWNLMMCMFAIILLLSLRSAIVCYLRYAMSFGDRWVYECGWKVLRFDIIYGVYNMMS